MARESKQTLGRFKKGNVVSMIDFQIQHNTLYLVVNKTAKSVVIKNILLVIVHK